MAEAECGDEVQFCRLLWEPTRVVNMKKTHHVEPQAVLSLWIELP